MKRHYEQLKEYNLKLKAKQKEVNFHVLWFFGFLGLIGLSLVYFSMRSIFVCFTCVVLNNPWWVQFSFLIYGICYFYS